MSGGVLLRRVDLGFCDFLAIVHRFLAASRQAIEETRGMRRRYCISIARILSDFGHDFHGSMDAALCIDLGGHERLVPQQGLGLLQTVLFTNTSRRRVP